MFSRSGIILVVLINIVILFIAQGCNLMLFAEENNVVVPDDESQIKKIDLPEGKKYTGEVEQGNPHGTGLMVYADGSIYYGEFKRGLRHGRGSLKGSDGSLFVGYFRRDVFHGEGFYRLTDGRYYRGSFRNGLFDGQGELFWPGNFVFAGKWEEGYLSAGDRTFEWPRRPRHFAEEQGIPASDKNFGFIVYGDNFNYGPYVSY